MARRTIILGAAGRDFHNFNTVYRNDPSHHVVAFTATQIPGIEGRVYPASLAGPGGAGAGWNETATGIHNLRRVPGWSARRV